MLTSTTRVITLFIIVLSIVHSWKDIGYCQPTSEGDSEKVISILATDEQGNIVTEAYIYSTTEQQWSSFLNGDPLSLKHLFPLSLRSLNDQSDIKCEGVDPEAMAALAISNIVVRQPNATTWCPYPLFPHDQIYYVELPNKAEVYLRLPESADPVKIVAGYENQILDLIKVDNVEVAREMIAGEVPDTDLTQSLLEIQIARQECLNYVAFTDKEGQFEALVDSVLLVQKLLEAYFERNGAYPYQLCQLYTGNNAIVGDFISYPFNIESNLCTIIYTKGLPASLEYYPEVAVPTTDGDVEVIGYWLAVLGKGETVMPLKPLPADKAMPLRAVKWMEKHPE